MGQVDPGVAAIYDIIMLLCETCSLMTVIINSTISYAVLNITCVSEFLNVTHTRFHCKLVTQCIL